MEQIMIGHLPTEFMESIADRAAEMGGTIDDGPYSGSKCVSCLKDNPKIPEMRAYISGLSHAYVSIRDMSFRRLTSILT